MGAKLHTGDETTSKHIRYSESQVCTSGGIKHTKRGKTRINSVVLD